MGRTSDEATVYARELGISSTHGGRSINRLGGAEKLRLLSPDVRAVLLSSRGYGDSRELVNGGLKARGMRRAKDIRSQ